MPVFTVEGPFTSKEVEKIYYDLMDSEFYNESYNDEHTHSGPYEAMARILNDIFTLSPNSIIHDLGCGRGYLVKYLTDMGFKAMGVEFSQRIINAIPPEDRQNISLVRSIQDMSLSQTDLLTSMEVFEHLPMAIIVNNLAYLRQAFAGYIFLTIPSSGYDRTLPKLGHAEVDEHRIAAMASNIVCPYLIIEDGYVSGGHITLASYRWWEDFFLTQGFVRQTAYEREYSRFIPELKAKGLMWCCYVLKALRAEEIAFGRGWYDSEGAFRWNGPDAELQLISEQAQFRLQCDLTLPDVNITLDAQLSYVVEQLDIVDDYRMGATVVASGRIDLNGAGRSRHVDIPVCRQEPASPAGPYPREDGAIKAFRAYKIHFYTPLWKPSDYGDSLDDRSLGFCFQDVRVSPPSQV